MEYKIDYKTAEEEFEKICEAWEIDIDINSMEEEEKVDFKGIKAKIIKAVRLGRLVYKGDGTMTYIVSKYSGELAEKELIIKRPKGSGLSAMDQFKEKAGVHKTFAVLASMISQPVQFLNNIDGIDLKPLLAISTLFLAE